LAEAAIAPEDVTVLAADRLRRDGGQFVIAVGFVEGSMANFEPEQVFDTAKKFTFVGDAADDQMRMRELGWKKRSRNLEDCVARLDGLLRNGEIRPDEDVDIRDVVLGEFHGRVLKFQSPALYAGGEAKKRGNRILRFLRSGRLSASCRRIKASDKCCRQSADSRNRSTGNECVPFEPCCISRLFVGQP
jgi:hypothetical protein